MITYCRKLLVVLIIWKFLVQVSNGSCVCAMIYDIKLFISYSYSLPPFTQNSQEFWKENRENPVSFYYSTVFVLFFFC